MDDYPNGSQPGWSDELQGVAHDDNYWFFPQNPSPFDKPQPTLCKFPIGHDLNADIDVVSPPVDIGKALLPPFLSNYEHFGDPDHFQGQVYLPIQGSGPPGVALYDAHTLAFIDSAELPNGTGAWCALYPSNGLYFESRFYEQEERPTNLTVQVYQRMILNNELLFEFLGDLELFDEQGSPTTLKRIQGGVISQNGHLYLTSDDEDNGALVGFDLITGRRRCRISIPVSGWEGEEIEGLTIWDLEGGGAPSIGGQIHIVMLDNDVTNDDDIYFKHFRVSVADRDKV